MAQFYNAHKLNIEQDFVVSYNLIQKGMVLEFKYKTLESGIKHYMVVVLNSLYEGKLHALTLNNFTPFIFNRMAEKLGVVYSKRIQKLRLLNIPHLIMEASSKRFYNADIKPFIEQKGRLNYSYRTFFKNKIGLVNAVNYKFKPSIMKKLKGTGIVT
jgi:hypothetical protein